jgi:NADH-quinone oxidoreductase subunit L
MTEPHELSHSAELVMMGVVTLLVVILIAYAWNKFSKYEKTEAESTGFAKVLENKWYVDELYEAIITRPVNAFGKFLSKVDKYGIDWVVNGVGRSVQYASRQVRLLQSGQVGSYVLLMVIGMIILFALQIFLKK